MVVGRFDEKMVRDTLDKTIEEIWPTSEGQGPRERGDTSTRTRPHHRIPLYSPRRSRRSTPKRIRAILQGHRAIRGIDLHLVRPGRRCKVGIQPHHQALSGQAHHRMAGKHRRDPPFRCHRSSPDSTRYRYRPIVYRLSHLPRRIRASPLRRKDRQLRRKMARYIRLPKRHSDLRQSDRPGRWTRLWDYP